MDAKSEAVKEGTMNQGTVRRLYCLEDDSRKSASWRPSGGSKPVSRACALGVCPSISHFLL